MNIFTKLDLIDLRLIEYKLMGLGYKDMELKLGVEFGDNSYSWTTIRDLFSIEGRLNKIYESHIEYHLKNIKDDAEVIFKSQIKRAVKVVIDLMNNSKSESVRLKTAKYILDRNFGPIREIIIEPKSDMFDQILLEIGVIEREDIKLS